MYTLLLIILAQGQTPVATHFSTPTKQVCEQTSRMLAAQSSPQIKVHAFCVPRVE